MHPEILRQLTAQRGQEMRARARQASLARIAIRGRRHGHELPDDDFAIPAIPDYVDGSFRTEPARTAGTGPAAGQVSGEAAAARHAA
jgi:hypothetical protein